MQQALLMFLLFFFLLKKKYFIFIIYKILKKSKNDKFLAVGNNIGNVFIFDMGGEIKPFKIDAHG